MDYVHQILTAALAGVGLVGGGIITYLKKRLKELDVVRAENTDLKVKVGRMEERLSMNAKNRNKDKYRSS